MSPTPNKPDNTVRTRQATEAEREKGASIEVGKATEPMESKDDPSKGDGDGDGGSSKSETKTTQNRVEDMVGTKAPVTGPKRSIAEGQAIADERERAESKRQAAFDKAAKNDPAAKKAAAAAEKKPGKFPDHIRDAVKFARYELSGKNPKLKGDAHRPAASAGQHLKVREHLVKTLTDEATCKKFVANGYRVEPGDSKVTPEAILKLTGMSSQKKLREVAEFQGTTEDLKPLQPLGEVFKGDSWAQGRYLAGIVVAFIEEIKSDAKAAAKAKKVNGNKAEAKPKAETKTPVAA